LSVNAIFKMLSSVDLSRKNPFYSVMAQSSLQAVIEIFSSNLGIHRINVMNSDGRVQGLLSKTDVVRFLLSKIDVFGEDANKTIEKAGLGKGPLVSVAATSTVLEALGRMSEYSISSIPVIDQAGGLMGNISMADVRVSLPTSANAN
jgi:CBS domain-containing protein